MQCAACIVCVWPALSTRAGMLTRHAAVHVVQYLPRLARGEIVGCFGLTEPNHGSDPGRCVWVAVSPRQFVPALTGALVLDDAMRAAWRPVPSSSRMATTS